GVVAAADVARHPRRLHPLRRPRPPPHPPPPLLRPHRRPRPQPRPPQETRQARTRRSLARGGNKNRVPRVTIKSRQRRVTRASCARPSSLHALTSPSLQKS